MRPNREESILPPTPPPLRALKLKSWINHSVITQLITFKHQSQSLKPVTLLNRDTRTLWCVAWSETWFLPLDAYKRPSALTSVHDGGAGKLKSELDPENPTINQQHGLYNTCNLIQSHVPLCPCHVVKHTHTDIHTPTYGQTKKRACWENKTKSPDRRGCSHSNPSSHVVQIKKHEICFPPSSFRRAAPGPAAL